MKPSIRLPVKVVWSEIGFESPASQAFLADLGAGSQLRVSQVQVVF